MTTSRSAQTVLGVLQTYPRHLKTPHTIAMARKIDASDKHDEIKALSRLFADSLDSATAAPLTQKMLTTLDKANCLTWLSYSLFDTITDHPDRIEQPHIITTLTALQVLKTEALQIYASVFPNAAHLYTLFEETDSAIHKEASTCKASLQNETLIHPSLPSKKILNQLLYGRSLAHITGPALITEFIAPEKVDETLALLKNYCALRQLMDDLYDWEEDLRNGSITVVVSALLKAHKGTEDAEYPLAELLPKLRELFWKHIAQDFCAYAETTIASNLQQWEHLHSFTADSPFIKATLLPILKVAMRTNTTIAEQKRLLKTLRRRQH